MDNSPARGQGAGQGELERYATLWGLVRLAQVNEDDRMTDRELFLLNLVCSVNYVDWTRVYKGFPDMRLTLDQLMQASRKVGHPGDTFSVDKSWPARLRDPSVVSSLFCGACFSEAAKQTTLYKELHEVLAPVEFCTDALEVMAFHLVGAPNLVSVVEDPRSPFVAHRIPNVRREMMITALQYLHQKWSKNNPEQVSAEAVVMIRDCQHPFLDALSGEAHTIMNALLHKQKPSSSSSSSSSSQFQQSMMRAPSSASARAKVSARQALGTLKAVETRPWSMAIELQMADNPRFRRYKQVKGWPAFHPSHDTVVTYLNEMSTGSNPAVLEDCKSMSSKETIQLVTVLAPYVEADIFLHSAQGRDFVRAMTATATPQQVSSWSTLDAAQRLLVAHHPDWQTHYSHAWNLDRTTITEMIAYRERWPTLPVKLFAPGQGDE